jgi:hypothetical protein
MPSNRKIKGLRFSNKQLFVIYPVQSNEQNLDLDFYHLLSFLKSNSIKYQWVNYDLSATADHYAAEFNRRFKDDIIFLYVPDITLLNKISDCLARLKKNNSFIMIGGHPAITAYAFEILSLEDSIDVIVRCPETEKVLSRLLKGLREQKELESLEGITFRQKGTGKIITTQSPLLSEDLDYLYNSDCEFLEQKLIDGDWYPLVTSRGCNRNCQYCFYQIPYRLNHKAGTNFWRARSAKKIVDEIETLIPMGINQFVFFSEQFFHPAETARATGHVKEIANEILERKLQPKLTCIAKAPELLRNFDSLLTLKDAGLEMVNIGIDSGLERFHQMYETGSCVQDNIEILKQMHTYHFNFNINFIFFDPFLSIAEIEKNLEFLEGISIYFSHLSKPYCVYLYGALKSVLRLQHGMPIIQKLRENNLVTEPPDFSSQPSIRFKDPRVKKIYSIYRLIDKNLLPSFKSRFESKEPIEKSLFPLLVMKKISTDVIENKVGSIPGYIFEAAAFLKGLQKNEAGR